MSKINWDDLAEKAASLTDAKLNKELASLTRLNLTEVDAFIKQSKITNENALKVLKGINDTTISNNNKVKTITNIENGVSFLIRLASKVV